MEKLDRVKSVAAPLLENAIDTDVIFPARFLLLLNRDGLGRHAFNERRGGSDPFVLDTPPYDTARILVTGETFGTGSSREQAVWALADLGIRCIVARSFGEIFFSNCFKNRVLPIVLSDAAIAPVERAALAGEEIEVDLPTQRLTLSDGTTLGFDVDPHRKHALLAGLDEVDAILAQEADAIAAHEDRRARETPWMVIGAAQFDRINRDEDVA